MVPLILRCIDWSAVFTSCHGAGVYSDMKEYILSGIRDNIDRDISKYALWFDVILLYSSNDSYILFVL